MTEPKKITYNDYHKSFTSCYQKICFYMKMKSEKIDGPELEIMKRGISAFLDDYVIQVLNFYISNGGKKVQFYIKIGDLKEQSPIGRLADIKSEIVQAMEENRSPDYVLIFIGNKQISNDLKVDKSKNDKIRWWNKLKQLCCAAIEEHNFST